MERTKASAFNNMKKPSNLNELHSRLATFHYHRDSLPYIKHILYPLTFMLRSKQFRRTEVEERAWQTAISLTKLNIRLTIPEAHDTLILTTDASKVAAAATLFRIRDNKLELFAASSKHSTTTETLYPTSNTFSTH